MNSNKLPLTASVTPQAHPAFYWTLADMLVWIWRGYHDD